MKENEIIEYSAEREEQKENINKNERKTNIELKIDEIYDYILKQEAEIVGKSAKKNKTKKRKENRKYINEILSSLSDLEKLANAKYIPQKELEDMTDSYFSAIIMKSKDQADNGNYITYREELRKMTRTKIFLNRIYPILDKYLDQTTDDNKIFINKEAEKFGLKALEVKQTILRRMYGYKLKPDETKCKSREQLADELSYSSRQIYNIQNELLDDLAPAILGVDGLNL